MFNWTSLSIAIKGHKQNGDEFSRNDERELGWQIERVEVQ